MKLQIARLMRASILIGVCAFAFPAMSMAIEQGVGSTPNTAGESLSAIVGLDASSIEWGNDPYAAFDRLEKLATEEGQPSDAFVREGGFPAGAYELHSDTSGMVVGCSLNAPKGKAFAAVCDVLAAKGWLCAPLRGTGGAAFVKQEGELRWMLVTCIQVGESTSVVYRMDCSGLGEA